MSNLTRHPFHMVDESPWPLICAVCGLGLTSGMIYWFHFNNPSLLLMSILTLLLASYQWWRDISREGTFIGLHTSLVELGLRWGMVLFITSEVFFFLSFFWAFFHSSLAPSVEIGGQWPPKGTSPFNPFGIPLLNTIVLLSSGVTVTWSHHALMGGNHTQSKQSLIATIVLGVYFTMLQAKEYMDASFSFADSAYGSTFFLATGFHGLHVIVGTLFLGVCLNRLNSCKFTMNHHFGFEAAAWYWHFVDVVWLFLFSVIYWWGGI